MASTAGAQFRQFLVRRIVITALLIGGLCLVGLAGYLKPADQSGDYSSYFASLNNELKQNGIGRPCIVLDLDRVDHNIREITGHLLAPLTYRIVTKSLPSRELVKYVMYKAGSNKLMAFHSPYLEWMIRELPGVEILLGKPLLIASVVEFYGGFEAPQYQRISKQIEWLVDTRERLNEYLQFAVENSITLKINFEIDVGLHRGGVTSNQELGNLLQIIAANPDHLVFSGFMGYDAHVPYAPPLISSVSEEFSNTMAAYADFLLYGKANFPQLFAHDLTFNSGGSSTYRMFTGKEPANDISTGSAIIKPARFSMLDTHQPALFIAAPIIKKLDGAQLPFLEFAAGFMEWWNPNMGLSLYLYGGGWAADLVSPPGVELDELAADPPNQNLMPNQSLYHASRKTPVGIGDFVFFQPQQSDAMSQFDEILVMRDGKLVDRWRPFPKRY